MIDVKVVNKSNHRLPEYATPGAAGMDLKANIDGPIVLGSLERQMIPTGLHIQLPDGYEARVQPRSGLAAKYGITVCLYGIVTFIPKKSFDFKKSSISSFAISFNSY